MALADLFGEQGIIVLVVIAVVLFGSTQIPKLARSLGSAQKEFKKGLDEGAGARQPTRPRLRRRLWRPRPRSPHLPLLPPLHRLPQTVLRTPLPDFLITSRLCRRTSERTRVPVPVEKGRWRITFWALQVLEFGIAFLLVTQSIHVGRAGILIAFGVVLVLLALTADGLLGVYRVCSQRLHVLLVAGAAIGLGALAFVPRLRPDAEGLLMIVVAAIAVVFLASRTITTSGSGGRRRARRKSGPVIDATATVVPPLRPPTDRTMTEPYHRGPTRTTPIPPSVGPAGPRVPPPPPGKRAVDEHRPQVEDQVKRGIRGAGRLAGKLVGPKTPPESR